MNVRVYQIDMEYDTGRRKFLGYDKTHQPDPSSYRCVYSGPLDAENPEEAYLVLNGDRLPGTYQGHSLSVSDVLEVVGENGSEFHFCNPVGWRQIGFDTSKCREAEGLRVLMLQPHEPPVETRIPDRLETWQRAVSDHGEDSLIEITYPFDDDVAVVGNDEAKLIGMEGNRRIAGAVYAGPLLLVGLTDEGGFRSLTDDEMQTDSEMFRQPEDITQDEVNCDRGFFLIGF